MLIIDLIFTATDLFEAFAGLATGPTGPLDPAADADHEEEVEADDAEDDEDREAGDLPSPSSILVPLHLLCLLLFQQSCQDQLQSLGVNVPDVESSCFIQLLRKRMHIAGSVLRDEPAKRFFQLLSSCSVGVKGMEKAKNNGAEMIWNIHTKIY